VFGLSDILAVGYCGSGRLGQLLEHQMESLDDPPLGRDEHTWAVKTFVPYVRDVLEAGGFLHVHHNVEHFGESSFLLAVRDRLFQVEGDLCVNEHALPFDAVGSGELVALGTLAARIDAAVEDPEERWDIAAAAVEASSEATAYVGGDVIGIETVRFTDEEREFARAMLKRRGR
jgi:hypothetical protein